MVLYTISFILVLLSCIVAGKRKRGWRWIERLPLYIGTSAVLALPTMLPLLFLLIAWFDLEVAA